LKYLFSIRLSMCVHCLMPVYDAILSDTCQQFLAGKIARTEELARMY